MHSPTAWQAARGGRWPGPARPRTPQNRRFSPQERHWLARCFERRGPASPWCGYALLDKRPRAAILFFADTAQQPLILLHERRRGYLLRRLDGTALAQATALPPLLACLSRLVRDGRTPAAGGALRKA